MHVDYTGRFKPVLSAISVSYRIIMYLQFLFYQPFFVELLQARLGSTFKNWPNALPVAQSTAAVATTTTTTANNNNKISIVNLVC